MSMDELQSDRYDAALEALLDFQDPEIAIKEGIELLDKAPHLAKAIPRLLANVARVNDHGSKKEVIYPILLARIPRRKLEPLSRHRRRSQTLSGRAPAARHQSRMTMTYKVILRYMYKYKIKTEHDFQRTPVSAICQLSASMWFRKSQQNYLLLNHHLLKLAKSLRACKREWRTICLFLRTKETLTLTARRPPLALGFALIPNCSTNLKLPILPVRC